MSFWLLKAVKAGHFRVNLSGLDVDLSSTAPVFLVADSIRGVVGMVLLCESHRFSHSPLR
jgi:hypothetical protein